MGRRFHDSNSPFTSILFWATPGGAGPSHRHCSEDLQDPREDRTPRPQRYHMSKHTCTHTHTRASTCSHRKTPTKYMTLYLFCYCAFSVSSVSFLSFYERKKLCWTLPSRLFIDHHHHQSAVKRCRVLKQGAI